MVYMSEDHRSGLRPVIALDGLSGSGKSTLARRLADSLGWAYLDSGAWYRALAWACVRAEADPRSQEAVLDTLSRIEIHGHTDGTVVVDGQPLSQELRTSQIDRAVADVADHPSVRQELVQRMRRLRRHPAARGVVADGRDAATVIFPDADLKVFVQASLEARAERRFRQRLEAGVAVERQEVLEALRDRDARDAARGPYAPHVAPGGLVLENTEVTVEEAVRRLLDLAETIPSGSQDGRPRAAGERPNS